MFETQRLFFRHWQDADAQALYELAKDPQVGPAAGWPVHTSAENSLEIIHTALAGEETYAMIRKDTGEIVGSAGIFPSDAKFCAGRQPEIGYWVGRKFWGQGFAPEAVEQMLSRCFSDMGAEAVWCSHFVGNDKSMRVMEKCGFRFHHLEYDTTWLAASGNQVLQYNRLTKAQYAAARSDLGKTPKCVLVTGFAPFGGETTNPSFEAVKGLPDRLCGAALVKKELPVVFGQAGEALSAAIAETKPDLVICTGQAGGVAAITLERVAVNLRDASIADNAGNQPRDERVIEGAPAAYFTKLPVKKVASSLREQAIPAQLSLSAGAYVCNDVFYTLLHELETNFPNTIGGFVHVPYLPAQAAQKSAPAASMELATITRALACVIAQSLQTILG